jgi:hypothetical protein
LVSIDDVLARELRVEDQDEVTDVIAALDLLTRLLTPEMVPDEAETLPPRVPIS